MRAPKNHFKVGVVFETVAFGIENLKNPEPTPAVVLSELEDFCARIRKEMAVDAERKRLADPAGPEEE